MEIKIIDADLYSVVDLWPKTAGSAGIDLKLTRDARSAYQLAVDGGQSPYYDLIGTGLAVAIPAGHVGLIIPRSSSGHKGGFRMGNTIGVIDSDYRGELMISVAGGDYGQLKRGAAVAQLVVMPIVSIIPVAVQDFSDTTARGTGGFGSTDTGCHECQHNHVSGCQVQKVLTTSDAWSVLHRSPEADAAQEATCELQQEREALAKLNGGF